MKEKFSNLVSVLLFLRCGSRSGSSFPSGNRVGRRLLGVLCLGFLGAFSLSAAQSHIILIDTSGSMNLSTNKPAGKEIWPAKGELSRIGRLKKALKKHIDTVIDKGDRLYLYKFNEGLHGKRLTVILNGDADRKKAKEWVDELTEKDGQVGGKKIPICIHH